MNGMSKSTAERAVELVLIKWWEFQEEEGKAFLATVTVLAKR